MRSKSEEMHFFLSWPSAADRVEALRDEAFPDLSQNRMTLGDWAGFASGVAAADAAVIARGPSIQEKVSA